MAGPDGIPDWDSHKVTNISTNPHKWASLEGSIRDPRIVIARMSEVEDTFNSLNRFNSALGQSACMLARSFCLTVSCRRAPRVKDRCRAFLPAYGGSFGYGLQYD